MKIVFTRVLLEASLILETRSILLYKQPPTDPWSGLGSYFAKLLMLLHRTKSPIIAGPPDSHTS